MTKDFLLLKVKPEQKARKRLQLIPENSLRPKCKYCTKQHKNRPQFNPVDTKTGASAHKKQYYGQSTYIPRVIRDPSINLSKEWELVTEVILRLVK
jgi:hypothetical protein